MIDRRTFIVAMSAAAVSSARLHATKIDRLGMQLYTVRDDMEKDFEGTLAKVGAIGYKEVEFAGYFKRTPQQVRDALKKAGLAAPAAHVDYPSLAADKLPAVLESARTIGHQFLVNPWIDETLRKEPDIWKRAADTFNRAGEASRKAGIQFAYHNHHFEFAPVDGKLPYDLLLEQCDPALVKMELDLCWITAAGKDPLEYFKKYPGPDPIDHVGYHRRRRRRHRQLETNFRPEQAGRYPALLRRARCAEGSLRQPEGELYLPETAGFLKDRPGLETRPYKSEPANREPAATFVAQAAAVPKDRRRRGLSDRSGALAAAGPSPPRHGPRCREPERR